MCSGCLCHLFLIHINEESPKLISLTISDVATIDIQSNLLLTRDRENELVREIIQDRLKEEMVHFFQPLMKVNSKTFGTLYTPTLKCQNETKIVKADRKLIQQLFNASKAGRHIEMGTIF